MANVSSAMPMCAEVLEGTLGTSTVSLVTTGIGHDSAAACMVDVLSHYDAKGETLVNIMYMGTSGWSPRVGGLFNPDTDEMCTEDRPVTSANELIGIGDVCISPMTFLFNCGFCNWNEKTVGECSTPQCTKSADSSVFGQCQFIPSDNSLADSLMKTAANVTFDARDAQLAGYLETYWDAMWTGLAMPLAPRPKTTPTVYDYTKCAEAASYNLWSGIPYDFRCRSVLSGMVEKQTGKPTASSDVVCVSAMEGPGWVSVLMQRAEKQGKHIPFVNIRAASNYDVWPVTREGTTILRNDSWLTSEQKEQFTVDGYRYAIKSASRIVLAHYGVPLP
eukprot:TRINITY_DN651_c0_g1_i2.p1 TRINITY_DN651_c0_g1~~TRINITY_DN651_c0_g1_i2.p1  ORF type:complete len:387 (+),score=149.23 TRINITY_DN651_c0_g1_i2:165-1163(+)